MTKTISLAVINGVAAPSHHAVPHQQQDHPGGTKHAKKGKERPPFFFGGECQHFLFVLSRGDCVIVITMGSRTRPGIENLVLHCWATLRWH